MGLILTGRVLGTALSVMLLSIQPSHAVRPEPRDIALAEETNRASVSLAPRVKNTTRSSGRTGFATYYARSFDGRTTASGTRFDSDHMVAAHPTYPFGTVVRVTNLRNGRSAEVRIVDWGPAAGPRRRGVIIDLSRAAAESLGFIRAGRARVRLEVVSTG